MFIFDPKKPDGAIDDPYPVRYFDNALDQAKWAELAGTFPADELLHAHAAGYKNRLCDRDGEAFSRFMKDHPPWGRFLDAIYTTYNQLCLDVIGVGGPGMKRPRFEFSALPADGGDVSPHPDTSKKAVTAVLFFNTKWDKEWGGAFEVLRHKTRPDDDFSRYDPPWDEVETVWKVDLVPNRILFMRRTNNSLHGVRSIKAPISRKTITVNLIGRG